MPWRYAVRDLVRLDPPVLRLGNRLVDENLGGIRHPECAELGLGERAEKVLSDIWDGLPGKQLEAMAQFGYEPSVRAAVVLEIL